MVAENGGGADGKTITSPPPPLCMSISDEVCPGLVFREFYNAEKEVPPEQNPGKGMEAPREAGGVGWRPHGSVVDGLPVIGLVQEESDTCDLIPLKYLLPCLICFGSYIVLTGGDALRSTKWHVYERGKEMMVAERPCACGSELCWPHRMDLYMLAGRRRRRVGTIVEEGGCLENRCCGVLRGGVYGMPAHDEEAAKLAADKAAKAAAAAAKAAGAPAPAEAPPPRGPLELGPLRYRLVANRGVCGRNNNWCAGSACKPVAILDVVGPDGKLVSTFTRNYGNTPGCEALACKCDEKWHHHYVLDFPEGATLEERRLLLMSILFAEQVVYPKRKQGPIQC